MKEKILIRRNYFLGNTSYEDSNYRRYYAAQLLNKFGILVDRPSMVTRRHVELTSELFGVNIPKSFYSNPQDMRYFTCSELLVEQVISYFNIEFVTGVSSDDESSFDRIEIFRKALPNYREGDEVVFRNFRILTDNEASPILEEVYSNLASYTRKWNETENEEFVWLFNNHVANDTRIKSKDNAIAMFNAYPCRLFGHSLDQKDVVKLSVEMIGREEKHFSYTPEQKQKLGYALESCYSVPLTNKQAKYFNTISRKLGYKSNETNDRSPYKMATEYMNKGRVVDAARIFARNGSLLERNLIWLLSRADMQEAQEIMKFVKIKNPIVGIQFFNGLIAQGENNGSRTFKFYKNRLIRQHIETDVEARYRKSVLSLGMKKYLKKVMNEKIDEYYKNLPSLGKVYVDDEFENIGLPMNTSASGTGIDVLPVGSRLMITEDYIRTFCYWNGPRDIDTSVIFIHRDGHQATFYWGNYYAKPFGRSALYSGDDRSKNGAEYGDFKISELKALGYTHAIYTLNGYSDNLDVGEIYCGYQNKKDLHTQAWDAKNIQMKIKVHGDSRSYAGFAIDFETREIIVLNQMVDSKNRVVNPETLKSFEPYLKSNFLDTFNVARIARLRGEVVTDPSKADYVFSRDYFENIKGQKVIRPSDIEKIVKLLN